MVHCPACNDDFHPRHRFSPSCASYEAPASARLNYLVNRVEDRIDRGTSTEAAVAFLQAEGVSLEDAIKVISERNRNEAKEARLWGIKRSSAAAD